MIIDLNSKGWTGRTGYVQDALRGDEVTVPRNTGVLLCGQRDMTDNVKQLLLDAGVFEGRILFNF
jgi:NAD(P)H-flavin reductase